MTHKQLYNNYINGNILKVISIIESELKEDYDVANASLLLKAYLANDEEENAMNLSDLILANASEDKLEATKEFLKREFLKYERSKVQPNYMIELKNDILFEAIQDRKRGNYARAKKKLKTYCKIDQDLTYNGYMELARIAKKQKNYELAKKYLEKVKQISTTPKYEYLMGDICFEEGKYEEAIGFFNENLRKSMTPNIWSYYELYCCYKQLNQLDLAEENLVICMLLDEDSKSKKIDFSNHYKSLRIEGKH